MLNQPEPACLVIADITGYTTFLVGAELDHAQDILADLMSTVVAALRPTFKLAKLEGDAAFVYVITDTVDGPQLQDTIEHCYFSFRRRLRDIGNASTCECNACMLVPRLDLKVVAHHGQVIRQRVAGREELVGSDIIVVHRLLKNHVIESTGILAYALYTEACIQTMSLADPAAGGLIEHREPFDGVGEIGGWVRDLTAAWADENRRSPVIVTAKETRIEIEAILPAPPPIVWDWVTSPVRRPRWQYAVDQVDERAATAGRRGAGTVNHCIHGKDAIVEEVLDWQPWDYVTYRTLLPIPNVPKISSTYQFEDLGDGQTRLVLRFAGARLARDRAILEPLLPTIEMMFRTGLDKIRPLIEHDAATRAAAAEVAPPEPAVPASAARNFQAPIPARVG